MTFNLQHLRDDTPGCANVIHFNNAGAALMPRPVIEAVESYFKLERDIGGYEACEQRRDQIDQVYHSIARLLGSHSSEVAVVENATRAWDMAFYSIPFEPTDRILTCTSEYASNYIALLQVCRRTGAKVEVIPNDGFGQVSLTALEKMIDPTVKLIAITHVPTNGGLVNPAQQIGKIAKRHGILYLLDACQSVGQLPINVKEIRCDMLSATSRKFLRGPRGMGFLYISSDLIGELEPPFLDLHAATWTSRNEYQIHTDARRFENWETNYSAKVGLGAAIDYALDLGLDTIWKRIQQLGSQFRESLSDIPGVSLYDLGQTKCGIVSFDLEHWDSERLKAELRNQRINVSVARAEHTLLDMKSRGLETFVRASLHYYNSEEELEKFCTLLKDFESNQN